MFGKKRTGVNWRGMLFLVLSAGCLFLPAGAFGQAGDGKKTVTIKVQFNDGDKIWGGNNDAGKKVRADFIANLKAQLESEWGNDVKVKRNDKEETIQGLNIAVSEGTAGAGELQIVIHNTDDADDGNFGSYRLGTSTCHIYPKNMKDTSWSTDPQVAQWVEKTAAHEVGHFACANDKNTSTAKGSATPDKMAQSGHLNEWAKNQDPQQTFDAANAGRTFSEALRQRQMGNLNKGGPQCITRTNLFDAPGYGGSVLVLDDPAGEEGGIANFAITVQGSRAGDFDLGFVNPGEDGLANTSDDYIISKWLGLNEMYLDWTPDDGIEDWVYFDEPLDDVVSLFDTGWYSWAAIDIETGKGYLLQEFGMLTLENPQYNDKWNTEVYSKAILNFYFDSDDIPDLTFILSSDLSNLKENDEYLYELNKYGTGFLAYPIPEPITLLGLTLSIAGIAGYLRRRL